MNILRKTDFRPDLLADPVDPRAQCGALCWRKHRGQVEVLLISSRDTGRWIIPKGWPHDGLTLARSAEAEAWEEAGVEGTLREAPLGHYSYGKILRPGLVQPCIVTVFGLRVSKLRARFPERRERRRKWFDAARAARKVAEPELRALLQAVKKRSGLLEVTALLGSRDQADGGKHQMVAK